MDFKVGDKVIANHFGGMETRSIGTIVKITPKRQDIVVDFGNYQETFDKTGWEKGSNIWYKSSIELLTPEIEKELQDAAMIRKCKDVFSKTKLTPELAKKILEVLNEVDVH